MIGENDSRFKFLEVKVGFFLLLALLGGVAVLVFIGLQSDLFTPKYRLHFTVDKGTGFSRGMPVKLSGFRIGRIDTIALNDQARVDVTLRIDRQYQRWIRRSSTARLTKEGLVGDGIVEIVVGATGDAPLQDGDTIAYEKAKGIEDHIVGLAEQAKPVLSEVGDIIAYVNDPQGDIKQSLHNLALLTRDLQTTRAKADILIEHRDRELTQISAQISGLLTKTDATLTAMHGTLARLDHTMATIDQRLPGLLTKVDASLDQLQQVGANAATLSSTAAQRVPPLLDQTETAIDDTGQVLRAVKQSWPLRGRLEEERTPQLLPGGSHD